MTKLHDKIASQQALVEKVRLLQAEERALRAEILKEIFGEDNMGTLKSQIGDYMITGTYGKTYSFNQADLEDAIHGDLLSADAESAIRTKYELNKKIYDNLDEEVIEELDDYLTVKPSLPSIKVAVILE